MSWFFGKKKQHKDSPLENPNAEQNSGAQDDYIFVSKNINPLLPDTDDNETQQNPNGGLYPSISGIPSYIPTTPQYPAIQNYQTDFHSMLTGIPFKLCSELEKHMNNDYDIDNLRINEILFFIERIQKSDYDYDFSVERSVISEMNSQSDE